MNIELSVIMPSYLGEYDGCASNRDIKFLRAVNSFISNDLVEKELVIIGDNCSITEKILKERYYNEIENGLIKFYNFKKKQKLFSGLLRSKGLEIAKGKYVCYLDSDDIIGVGHLKTILQQIKVSKLDWAYFNDYIDMGGNIVPKKVNLVKDSIGTSSIIHKINKSVNWKNCDGYGHDFIFIQKLIKWSKNYDKIYGGTYIICHIPNQFDN